MKYLLCLRAIKGFKEFKEKKYLPQVDTIFLLVDMFRIYLVAL